MVRNIEPYKVYCQWIYKNLPNCPAIRVYMYTFGAC